MVNVRTCIACDGPIEVQAHGMVAPFLAARIWNRRPFSVELVRCEYCAMSFFNPRLEPSEEDRLYEGYRSDAYQRLRQAVEPWYTSRLNQRLGDKSYLYARQAALRSVLQTHLSGRRVTHLLDFGGHRGALVRNLLPGANAFVYDISGVEPEPGVLALRTLDECRAHRFDLIINSHVLEHVGSPRNVVAQMREIASADTALFVEVPHESLFSRTLLVRRAVQLLLLLTMRPAIGAAMVRRGGLCWMHEHVNYFTVRSLEALVTHARWTTISAGAYRLDSASAPSGTVPALWCIALASRNDP
jgi:hypothetical protein